MSALNRFTRLPETVFAALSYGDIEALQFFILAILHRRADRKTGVVHSFSAEQAMRDLGDQTNLLGSGTSKSQAQRIQRAMRSLRKAGWFTWDYVRGQRRPYKIWLSNYVSLYVRESTSTPAIGGGSDADIDAEERVIRPTEIIPCEDSSSDTDAEDDAEALTLSGRSGDADMTLSTYSEAKPRSNAALAPERDSASPGSLPFGAGPVETRGGNGKVKTSGLKDAGKENLLTIEQQRLDEAAILFADFINSLWGFVPNPKDVAVLLSEVRPSELLLAQLEQFPLGDKFRQNTMAYFFAQGAKTIIKAKRLKGPSDITARIAKCFSMAGFDDTYLQRWSHVKAAWKKSVPTKPSQENSERLERMPCDTKIDCGECGRVS